VPRTKPDPLAGAQPLSPRQKWRAILLATLLMVPGYWSLLAGVVAVASDQPGAPAAGPLIAFGLAIIPFVFVVLAFTSGHPRAPGAIVKAMVLALVVGIPVSAVAQDAVTGFVAGMGAGGIAALRPDVYRGWKARALGVAVASAGIFLFVRVAGVPAILITPAVPFSALGVADHIAERRREERAANGPPASRGPARRRAGATP
jgi:hypothetical protein